MKSLSFLVNIFLAYSMVISFSACKTSQSDSSTKTDLGTVGNQKVVKQLKAYIEKTEHCDGTGDGTRILLSGFGLFSNPPRNERQVPYNISGLITRFMSTGSIYPSTINTATSKINPTYAATEFAVYSHMPDDSAGGVVVQREMEINQHKVTVCYLLLDVIWDQAASIILYEATQFKPDRIIMSGLNGNELHQGIFEGGAVNDATDYNGFGPNGQGDQNNVPQENVFGASPVLPPQDFGVEQKIKMTWNNQLLLSKTKSLAESITPTGYFSVRREADARPSNNYICNNVSFVVLHAIKGALVNLAGGKLRLGPPSFAPQASQDVFFIPIDPQIAAKVKSAGFFHYPNTKSDLGETMFGWANVMAQAMVAGL